VGMEAGRSFVVCAVTWMLLFASPAIAQESGTEVPATRAEAIAEARADKVAELWPERQSPLVNRVNALLERGLKEGLDSGRGVNGPQIVLGGMRSGQGFTAGLGYRRSDLWRERLGYRATARGTFQGAYLFDFDLDFQGLRTERTSLRSYTKYESSPHIDYYGQGNDSRQDRHTNYGYDDFSSDFDAAYAVARHVRLLLDRSGLGEQEFASRIGVPATDFAAYLGGTVEFTLSPLLEEAFRDVAGAVRHGGTVAAAGGTVFPDHPVWVRFARAMMPMMRGPAEALVDLVAAEPGRPLRVLDIAAGHGLFGIAFARRHPRAEITAVDWTGVLEVARDNATAAGVATRYRVVPGSAFDVEWGEGYDVALLTNFLHHFDPAACERLLARVRRALAPGGRAVTLEFVPNADRVSPAPAAAFSLVMLCTTPAGDAYTFAELDAMLRRAGFTRNILHPLPNVLHALQNVLDRLHTVLARAH